MRWLSCLAVLAALLVGPALAQETGYPRAEAPDDPTGRLERIIRRGTLIVGVKNDYPPWGQIGPGEAPEGLEPDMARELADRLGVELELVVVTASNRTGWLGQGVVDVVIATMGDTVVRRTKIDMIEPSYYSSGAVMFGPPLRKIEDWETVRGQPVCLTQGAYFNRTIEEEFGGEGRYFPANREARMALNFGRCAAWAFDDTAVVEQMRAEPLVPVTRTSESGEEVTQPEPRNQVLTDPILLVPWAIGVASGEGQGDLGLFLSDVVGEWHATGQFARWQERWNLPQTLYHRQMTEVWSRMSDGAPFCQRNAEGVRPAECLGPPPLESAARPEGPPWVQALAEATGIDLAVLYDAYDRGRLIRGLGLTLALSAVAIAGALVVGVSLGFLEGVFRRVPVIGPILLLPQRIFVVVARMTPPILQLYIVFFGLGGVLANNDLMTPGAFVTAAVILSFYAGATNTVLLSHALAQERALDPDAGFLTLFPLAFQRAFDGLVATCVNIVKAAGMASAIALAELISTVNLLVSDGADATTLMNGLLVFYFIFVLVVMAMFRALRGWVIEGRHP